MATEYKNTVILVRSKQINFNTFIMTVFYRKILLNQLFDKTTPNDTLY
ncbi:hypothetical protein SeKA_B0018 (plasmid) [Salmonella enterica subsp. enterica serovar Kentucky str. CVM29188]|nr:hypothetical protein SeKA_B0018 [Salmonella enterica subsp. enterica serovar Kentucky str. CVM29188]